MISYWLLLFCVAAMVAWLIWIFATYKRTQ